MFFLYHFLFNTKLIITLYCFRKPPPCIIFLIRIRIAKSELNIMTFKFHELIIFCSFYCHRRHLILHCCKVFDNDAYLNSSLAFTRTDQFLNRDRTEPHAYLPVRSSALVFSFFRLPVWSGFSRCGPVLAQCTVT